MENTTKKVLIVIFLSIISEITHSEIPEWYKRDIVIHIQQAKAVVLFKVKNVSLVSASKHGVHTIYSYRVDTKTLELLKGAAPTGQCYMIHTEEQWQYPYNAGDEEIVILNVKYGSYCGKIEPGFAVPATPEYIELFRAVLKSLDKS